MAVYFVAKRKASFFKWQKSYIGPNWVSFVACAGVPLKIGERNCHDSANQCHWLKINWVTLSRIRPNRISRISRIQFQGLRSAIVLITAINTEWKQSRNFLVLVHKSLTRFKLKLSLAIVWEFLKVSVNNSVCRWFVGVPSFSTSSLRVFLQPFFIFEKKSLFYFQKYNALK